MANSQDIERAELIRELEESAKFCDSVDMRAFAERFRKAAALLEAQRPALNSHEDWFNPNSCSYCGMVGGHAPSCRDYTSPSQPALECGALADRELSLVTDAGKSMRVDREKNAGQPAADDKAMQAELNAQYSLGREDGLNAAKAHSEALAAESAEQRTCCNTVEQLSELMRGLEIPPAASVLDPNQLFAIGQAIARQAKLATATPPAGVPDGWIDAVKEAIRALEVYESLPRHSYPGPPTTALAGLRAMLPAAPQPAAQDRPNISNSADAIEAGLPPL